MSGKLPMSLGSLAKREGYMIGAKAEARELVSLIAGPLRLGENVKAVLARVARTTGLGNRRVRGIWNGEARSIRAEEMDRLRAAAQEARTVEDAQNDFSLLLARLAACEEALGLPAANMDRPAAAALGIGPRSPYRALDRTAEALNGPTPGTAPT